MALAHGTYPYSITATRSDGTTNTVSGTIAVGEVSVENGVVAALGTITNNQNIHTMTTVISEESSMSVVVNGNVYLPSSDGKIYGKYPLGDAQPSMGGSAALPTSLTLTADDSVTPNATELVTFGLPFSEGDVADVNALKVSIDGVEQAAYVESGLSYHWSDGSIRSAIIQLQDVDMTSGDVVVTIEGTGSSVSRLTEQPHSNGWANATADKNLDASGTVNNFPRIWALHDPDYLAGSGIIPPYTVTEDGSDFFTFQSNQANNWSVDLDYPTSIRGNWLFDRSSAYFKAYMGTRNQAQRVIYLKEAFLAKRFYMNHLETSGTPAAPGGRGGWTWGGTSPADGKYCQVENAKLCFALCGDSSQWDDTLIRDIALQADLGWNQHNTRSLYDSESKGFTERAAGLVGLAEITSYEMTGDATVLSNLNERIASLEDMQQTEKSWDTANGWSPMPGYFRHSYQIHEGGTYPGDGTANDRAGSPWMSENIADFLWHTYWITGNSKIPEILRRLGNAIDLYGFTHSYNPATTNYDAKPGWTQHRVSGFIPAEQKGAVDLFYFMSDVADSATVFGDGFHVWYSEVHCVEIILPLTLAYYFETDADNRARLLSRINAIKTAWIPGGSSISSTERLWNWQHRSNSVRTSEWVEAQ